MADSKNSAKNPKIMDVSHPGKTPPPSSGKPIIVTNRPLIKQDPMMAVAASEGLPEGRDPADIVSRVGKPIRIEPLTQEEPQASPAPADSTAPPAEQSGAAPTAPKVTKINIKPLDTTASPAPALEPAVPMESPAPAETAAQPEVAKEPEAPAVPPAAVDAAADVPSPTASVSDTPAPAAQEEPAPSVETSADGTETTPDDKQLAPNKALEDAKKKEEEQKAARQAELEKVIESKQYFLPIRSAEARRGLRVALLLLLLVLVLALVWLDIALDAGIVHIGGLHSLTHLFNR